MSEAAQVLVNCPFYGRQAVLAHSRDGVTVEKCLTFLGVLRFHCALVLYEYHYCDRAIEGRPIDWRGCPQWENATQPPTPR